ncbi:hypothetical protein JOQ06_010007 [Pogonophryne albipinna]|uniref:Uncharacterized protein n=1 Tax=Pogonophryne albipinna TaxID=1090488 RepID=A0AAD6A4B4_9TELE|nr:hypothetical protein JOQ06_010007 [Pogonophryne albipinna]
MISALSITLNLFCLWGVGIQGSVKAEVDKPDTSTVVPQDGTELDSASCGPNPEDMPDVSPEKSQNDTDSASCEPRLEVRQDTDNSLSSPNDNESSSVDDSQEAMAHNLCGLSLNELLSQYYHIVTGQGKEHALALPILHRCLSHVMKNAKDLCKKHAAKHYRLCMHVFGLMTQATTLKELDQVVVSATVLLASPCSGENVEKHFKDLQTLLTAVAQPVIDDSGIAEEDFVNDLGPTPFDYHFKDVIQQASLDKVGEPNEYFCPNFIPKLLKYFLPQAALWSRLLLGDLGRHGRGPFYEKLSKRFKTVAQKSTQNYTKDNMTQGIMEKSQWDLKKIRFQQKRLTRLDDFVHTYKVMHNALLREYQDSLKTKNKTHRVDVERWKQRKQRRRGVYVTPITKPFEFKKSKAKKVMKKILNPSLSTSNLKEAQEKHRDSFPQHTPSQLKSPHQSTSVISDAHEQKPSPEHVTSQVNFLNKAL